jgi:hypothetical protein
VSRLDSRLTALERLLAPAGRQTPCAECSRFTPAADPRDADAIRDRIRRKLERLAATVTNALPWPGIQRCGTCGQMDTQAMRRRLEGSNT